MPIGASSQPLSIDLHLNSLQTAMCTLSDHFTIDQTDASDDSKIARIKTEKGYESDASYDVILISPYEIQNLESIRQKHEGFKIVFSLPAIWWYEHPDLFPFEFILEIFKTLNLAESYILVPNDRIADYLNRMSILWVGLDISHKLIVFPYYSPPLKRNEESFRSKMIVDSGGPWRWTDNDTFLQAFVDHVNETSNSELKFQMFLKEKSNRDHSEFEQKLLNIASGLNNRNSLQIDNWTGLKSLNNALAQAAFGLQVNKNSIESYLSSRVRLRNYQSYSLPTIATTESTFAEEDAALLVPVKQDYKSYRDVLNEIEAGTLLGISPMNYQVELAIKIRESLHQFENAINYGLKQSPVKRINKTFLDVRFAPSRIPLVHIEGSKLSIDELTLVQSVSVLNILLSDSRIRRAASTDGQTLKNLMGVVALSSIKHSRRIVKKRAAIKFKKLIKKTLKLYFKKPF
jgi:hypothetical protein